MNEICTKTKFGFTSYMHDKHAGEFDCTDIFDIRIKYLAYFAFLDICSFLTFILIYIEIYV